MSDRVRQGLALAALVLVVAVNALANIIPFNGQTTAAVSDKFQVLFVPAGYVFAIWGIIYIGLTAFAVFQAMPSQADNPRLRRVGYLFALSCLVNAAWLVSWHYEQFGLTVLLMLSLLALLIVIYLQLHDGQPATNGERWLARVPFSIYLGWISVATIANVSDFLWLIHWNGFGISPEIWTVVMLAAGFCLATAMLLTRRDIAYALVIIWAFAGIAVKQAPVPVVSTAAWVLAATVAVVAVAVALRRSSHTLAAG